MITYFIFGLTLAFASVIQPGPFQAFLFSQSLTHGWRKTIPLVFAPLLSDIPIIVLVVFILMNIPHQFLLILQCFGGLFLLYLAFTSYKTWHKLNRNDKQYIPYQRNFLKAVLVNLLNPAPYLGWSLIMGPLLIKGWTENPINGIVLLIGFYGSMMIYSMVMVILFAAAGNSGPRSNRISTGISIIALVIFGCYQLWSGITGFM